MVVGDIGKTIKVPTDFTLTGSDKVAIFYCKPDKTTTGEFTGTIDPTDATTILHVTVDGDIDQDGKWVLRSVKYNGTDPIRGYPVTMPVESLCNR